ncbi:MAG: FAD binding domain-containing protein, partial [Elusimicrobiota bacterium]
MPARSSVVFRVNSRRFEVSGRDCLRTLSDFLRHDLALPGTKVVCAEGDCGACTVLVGGVGDAVGGRLRYKAVNSCILPLYALDACHVITVEGLRDGDRLHPVQTALVKNHATQCGYCTPGLACSMTALVEEALAEGRQAISEKKARNGLTGNLCRCTGYDSILKAAQSIPLPETHSLSERRHDQDLMREFTQLRGRSVAVESGGVGVFIPATLDDALHLKKRLPDLKIVGGSTDTGVLVNKGLEKPARVMSLAHVQELRQVRKDAEWAEVGAAVTLDALEHFAEAEVPELGRLLHVFASPQIKNRATLAGNAVNASPIGDLIPFLLVSDAELE